MKTKTLRYWSRDQLKDMVKEIRKKYEKGWVLLGAPVQQALIDSYVLGVAFVGVHPTVEKDILRELRIELMRGMGLLED